MKIRTHVVATRLSPAESARLDELRGKMQRGRYIRHIILGGATPPRIPEINRIAYAETARWAANLNQIAHRLNAGDTVSPAEVAEILTQFRRALLGLTAVNADDR
mgnify:CR=1 FL=1